jgi:hypothetical protein
MPETFVPIMYLIDNAKNLQSAEQIVSTRYFSDNPERKFDLLDLSIGKAAGAPADVDDDQTLVWLMESSAKPDAYFVGVSATVVPKSAWLRYPELAKELLRPEESRLIAAGLVESAAKDLLVFCDNGAGGIGAGSPCLFSGRFDNRPNTVAVVRVSADEWKLDWKNVGVRKFSYYKPAAQINSAGCSFVLCNDYKGTYRVRVSEHTFELNKRGRPAVFDATTDSLVVFSYVFSATTIDYVNKANK